MNEKFINSLMIDIVGAFLLGGKSNETPVEYDPNELKLGIEIEKEHFSAFGLINEKLINYLAEKVAKDHLAEFPYYYTALKKMEQELSKEK